MQLLPTQTLQSGDTCEVNFPRDVTITHTNDEAYVVGITPCQCDECDEFFIALETPFMSKDKDYCRMCEINRETNDRYERVETPFGTLNMVRSPAVEPGQLLHLENRELPITSMLQQQRQDMEEQMIQGIGSAEFGQMLEQQREYTRISAEQGLNLSVPNDESLTIELPDDGPTWIERFRNMNPMTFAQEMLGNPNNDSEEENELDQFEALSQRMPARTRRASSLRGARVHRITCPRCRIEYHSNNAECPRCDLRNPRRNPNDRRAHCSCGNTYSNRLIRCPRCSRGNDQYDYGDRALWAVECRNCGLNYDVPEGHYKNCPRCGNPNRASQAVEKMEKPHDNIPKEKRMEYSKLPQEVKDLVDKAYMSTYCDIDEHVFETEDEKVIKREIEKKIRQSFVQRLIEDDRLKIEKVKENHPGLHRRTIEAYVFQMDDWLDALIQVFWAGFDYHKEQTNQSEPPRLKDDGTP